MANALIVHPDNLPASQTTLRAAQYVRMSTGQQRYSIENQAAVIVTYPLAHDEFAGAEPYQGFFRLLQEPTVYR